MIMLTNIFCYYRILRSLVILENHLLNIKYSLSVWKIASLYFLKKWYIYEYDAI